MKEKEVAKHFFVVVREHGYHREIAGEMSLFLSLKAMILIVQERALTL